MIGGILTARCAAQQARALADYNRYMAQYYADQRKRDRIAAMPRYDGKTNIPVVNRDGKS